MTSTLTSTRTTTPTTAAAPTTAPITALSGITPSGSLTLGNHLGALRRFGIEQRAARSFYFVADLHALTTRHDPALQRARSRELATVMLAAGIDPAVSTLFVQSRVPAHTELGYLLECTAHVGELGRMVQFKTKGSRPGTRASLFTYPCLMAADILLYDADEVPVGGDQDQHVELARVLAERFNHTYGETFRVPRVAAAERTARIADLADPTAKMSKSDPDSAAGVVRVLDPPEVIRRKVMRAVTDDRGEVRFDPVGQPGVSNLLTVLAACTGDDPEAVADGFTGYADLKRAVVDAVVAELAPLQRAYAELAADAPAVDAVLADGAVRAQAAAAPVLQRARRAIGLD